MINPMPGSICRVAVNSHNLCNIYVTDHPPEDDFVNTKYKISYEYDVLLCDGYVTGSST
jgi:hypothetical protein